MLMQGGLGFILKSLFVVFAYILVGNAALTFEVSPGFGAPIWPPAAIALVAILLGGYRYLPAILVASYVSNLLVTHNAGGDVESIRSSVIALFIAVGAASQAGLATFLLRRNSNFSTSLATYRDILSLVILGGLVSSTVKAIIGPATLYAAAILPANSLLLNISMWWIGDAIGVVLFAPILLLVFHPNVASLRKITVSLPLLIISALVVLFYVDARENQSLEKQLSLEASAKEVRALLSKEMEVYKSLLTANERFRLASDEVKSDEFKLFTQKFFQQHEGVHGLGWLPKVTREQRAAHEKAIQRQGYPDFTVKRRFEMGKMDVSEPRDVYYVISYVEPYGRNKGAHGLDVYGIDPVVGDLRVKALDKARDTGNSVATARFPIVQAENQYGFIIYHPVFDLDVSRASVEEKRAALIGYMNGIFLLPSLMKPVTALANKLGFDVVVTDIAASEKKQMLYDSRTPNYKEAAKPISSPINALLASSTLEVGGREWSLTLIQQSGTIDDSHIWRIWYLLVGGLLLSAMLGMLLLAVSASSESAVKQIEIEESGLRSRNAFWPAIGMTILILLASSLVANRFISQEAALVKRLLLKELFLVEGIIQKSLAAEIKALVRMVERGQDMNKPSSSAWREDAQNYVKHHADLQSIELIGTDFSLQDIEPKTAVRSVFTDNMPSEKARIKALAQRDGGDSFVVTKPRKLKDGKYGMLAYFPRFSSKKFVGYLVANLEVERLIDDLLPDNIAGDFYLSVSVDNLQIFNSGSGDKKHKSVSHKINVYGTDWKFEVEPRPAFLQKSSALPHTIVYLAAGLLSLLAGFAVYTTLISNQRSQLLKRKSELLLKNEYKLQEQVQFNQTVFDTAPVLIGVMNNDYTFRSINAYAQQALGYGQEELAGNEKPNMFHLPEELEARAAELSQELGYEVTQDDAIFAKMQAGDYSANEWTLVRKDGSTFPVLLSVVPLKDNRDEQFGILAVALDISEQKAYEKQLSDAANFQKLMLENNPDLIFVKDDEFKIIQANQAFINVYPEEMHDKIIGYTTLEEYDDQERELFLAKDKEAFKDGYSETVENINFPDGYMRTLFTQKVRFENTDGERFILCIARDITEREALIDDLKRSNRELDDFAYIASHDLKEPLRGIFNHSRFLQKDYKELLDEDGNRRLDRVLYLTQRLERLISELFYYSRLGRVDQARKETKLRAVVNDVISTLDEEEQKAVSIKGKLPVIHCDPVRITELLRNLITNAIKYNESDPKKVEVGLHKEEKDFVTLYVKDNGIGIAERHHQDVFKIFKRLHKKSAYGGGTGAGLTFVKKIAEQHGGEIRLESEEEKGTIFYIKLNKG